jgi:hypothetical protein
VPVLRVALARGVTYDRVGYLGAAIRVISTRAAFEVSVVALTADAVIRPCSAVRLVALTGVALMLVWVDGYVGRRTS